MLSRPSEFSVPIKSVARLTSLLRRLETKYFPAMALFKLGASQIAGGEFMTEILPEIVFQVGKHQAKCDWKNEGGKLHDCDRRKVKTQTFD